jgi:hypothetical protein
MPNNSRTRTSLYFFVVNGSVVRLSSNLLIVPFFENFLEILGYTQACAFSGTARFPHTGGGVFQSLLCMCTSNLYPIKKYTSSLSRNVFLDIREGTLSIPCFNRCRIKFQVAQPLYIYFFNQDRTFEPVYIGFFPPKNRSV